MTREEFHNTRFRIGMKAVYDGEVCQIVGLNFEEDLLGLDLDPVGKSNSADLFWVRCENVEVKGA